MLHGLVFKKVSILSVSGRKKFFEFLERLVYHSDVSGNSIKKCESSGNFWQSFWRKKLVELDFRLLNEVSESWL